jgi:hypothetical protein
MAVSRNEIAAIARLLCGEMKKGSSEDMAARRSLAKVLRYGPPDRGLCFVLADLIDPDQRKFVGMWLEFQRPRGRKRTTDRRRVAAIIWKELRAGKRQKAAVSIAMEKCGVRSRDKALSAYKTWKPIFERNDPKMKALTRTD